MRYIDFLKKNKNYLNKYILELLIEQINLRSLKKLKKLKNTSRFLKNRRIIAKIKTILNI